MQNRAWFITIFQLMHATLMSLQVTTLFGFKCATINITMLPSYANIMDITLVFLHATTIFGFKCATINVTVVPNYANIVDIHLMLLQGTCLNRDPLASRSGSYCNSILFYIIKRSKRERECVGFVDSMFPFGAWILVSSLSSSPSFAFPTSVFRTFSNGRHVSILRCAQGSLPIGDPVGVNKLLLLLLLLHPPPLNPGGFSDFPA